jgi:type IV secretory pathway VirB2 component (pilin)
MAAALVVTGAASAMAATPASPSWQIVKRVHSGNTGEFTAVVAVGKTGGWAFNGVEGPTAWRRSGSSWTRVPFPGHSGEVAVLLQYGG